MDRLTFHDELCCVLGSKKVYFQPPASIHLEYPCIVYNLSNDLVRKANNKNYIDLDQYTVTIIDRDPDSKIYRKLKNHRYVSFDSFFVSDNLNHWVLTIYR